MLEEHVEALRIAPGQHALGLCVPIVAVQMQHQLV